MTWAYQKTEWEPDLYTVGIIDPETHAFIVTDDDFSSLSEARRRVNYLNGGTGISPDLLLSRLDALVTAGRYVSNVLR